MNSRVRDASDFIERDCDGIENLPLPDDYVPDSQLESLVTLITSGSWQGFTAIL